MPKDNEVDEKAQTEELIRRLREVLGANGSGPETTLLARAQYHAATVAELRAEVERLRKSNELYSFAMNTAGIDELKRRADAAERRVGELTSLLSDTVGNLRRMANDEFADCDQVRLEHVVNRIEHTLTGADPT